MKLKETKETLPSLSLLCTSYLLLAVFSSTSIAAFVPASYFPSLGYTFYDISIIVKGVTMSVVTSQAPSQDFHDEPKDLKTISSSMSQTVVPHEHMERHGSIARYRMSGKFESDESMHEIEEYSDYDLSYEGHCNSGRFSHNDEYHGYHQSAVKSLTRLLIAAERSEQRCVRITRRYEKELAECREQCERDIWTIRERFESGSHASKSKFESELKEVKEKYERETRELKEKLTRTVTETREKCKFQTMFTPYGIKY